MDRHQTGTRKFNYDSYSSSLSGKPSQNSRKLAYCSAAAARVSTLQPTSGKSAPLLAPFWQRAFRSLLPSLPRSRRCLTSTIRWTLAAGRSPLPSSWQTAQSLRSCGRLGSFGSRLILLHFSVIPSLFLPLHPFLSHWNSDWNSNTGIPFTYKKYSASTGIPVVSSRDKNGC